MRKKIFAILIAFTMFFLNTAETILAFDDIVKDNNNTTIYVTRIDEHGKIYETKNTGFTFEFEIKKDIGQTFKKDEEYILDTNLAEFFTIENNKTLIVPVEDNNKEEILKAEIYTDNTDNKIKINLKLSKNIDATEISGTVLSVDKFVTKDNLVTSGESINKTITIGNGTKDITIYKNKDGSGTGDDPRPVDIDTLWKTAESMNNKLGSVTKIEVNPIGSMDLYASTSEDKERGLIYHENFIVRDEIPEKGYIDEDSMQIYAVVPTLAKAATDQTYHGWYDVKKGNYYAQRYGTQRYIINEYNNNPKKRIKIKKINQGDDETYADFEARIKQNSLTYGIYINKTEKTETFLCNFGNIGNYLADKNNGIKYSDFKWHSFVENYLNKYPGIFGENGASAGNVVSYYIEFDSYYPEIEGQKEVANEATRISKENGNTKPSTNGNTAKFIINNGYGFGSVRKNSLALLLVDEADKTKPISGAKFELQKEENGQWIKKFEGTTDDKGKLKFDYLNNGKYKVVQTSTAQDYEFDKDNNKYQPLGNNNNSYNDIGENGEFEITGNKSFGFAALVTNKRIPEFNVTYSFISGTNGKDLPNDKLPELPKATKVKKCSSISAPTTKYEDIKVDGGKWRFDGWKPANQSNVTTDVEFIGTWKFMKNSTGGGTVTPEPEDPDRIEGGDRVDTSIDTSEDLFPNGTDAVVLANCERYTDVLTANPFAIQIKAAALFTYKDKLPEKTLKEIERLGAKKIYISGGYDAVSKKVVDELINKGYDVFRFDGVNRYDTARKIAIKIRENGNKNVAELASGENYPDALSMTSMAVKDNAPILLTKKDSIPSYTKQALAEWDIETIKIAGLDEAISNNVEKQIKNGFAIEENNKKDSNVYDGAKVVSRFGGKDRYETSTVIAKESYPNSELGVYATGEKFPDALIAGNYAGRKKAPVLLVKKDTLPESVKKYTANSKIEKATIIGGSKAVSDNVIEFIKEAIKNRKN